jgi:hypothetical protein
MLHVQLNRGISCCGCAEWQALQPSTPTTTPAPSSGLLQSGRWIQSTSGKVSRSAHTVAYSSFPSAFVQNVKHLFCCRPTVRSGEVPWAVVRMLGLFLILLQCSMALCVWSLYSTVPDYPCAHDWICSMRMWQATTAVHEAALDQASTLQLSLHCDISIDVHLDIY